jgi:hypothetical protein
LLQIQQISSKRLRALVELGRESPGFPPATRGAGAWPASDLQQKISNAIDRNIRWSPNAYSIQGMMLARDCVVFAADGHRQWGGRPRERNARGTQPAQLLIVRCTI